ncbi:uncharacterized protein KRP23_1841 [Phytophthora ramorum]|nr:hypothetical protein KRP23_1841 [Phytophthora ramorum]
MATVQFLVSFLIVLALATPSSAQELAAENELGRLLDESESGDGSTFSSSDSGSAANVAASDVDVLPDTLPPDWIPPVAQPVVDGVKMFGQCGGIFYSGTTDCADPDAYCKQLSVYSSICSPRPVA